MAGELSAGLIDEASQALTSVVRLTLPAERWTAVGAAVNRMDDAVWAGNEDALGTELKKLRGAVIGTAPRPRAGESVAPTINPLSYRSTDYATRIPIRWISAILIGGAVLLTTLIVVLLVVLTVGKNPAAPVSGPSLPTTATTMTAPPPTSTPPAEPSGGVYVISVAVLAGAGVLAFVCIIWRRRSRGAGPQHTSRPTSHDRVSDRAPPAWELVDAVDRVVMILAARRDEL